MTPTDYERRVEGLVMAIGFYASMPGTEVHIATQTPGMYVVIDRGEKARQALADFGGEK